MKKADQPTDRYAIVADLSDRVRKVLEAKRSGGADETFDAIGRDELRIARNDATCLRPLEKELRKIRDQYENEFRADHAQAIQVASRYAP